VDKPTTETVETGTTESTTSLEGEETVVNPGTETDPENQEGTEAEPSEDQTPTWAKKRFGKLTHQREEEKRQREAAEQERDFYKKLILEKQGDPKQTPATPKTQELVEPKLEDFDDYGKYTDAVVDYKLETKLREQLRMSRQRSEAESVTSKFFEKVNSFKQETPDYDTFVGNPAFVQSPALVEALLTSDMGPQLAYHLAKNLKEVDRLNQMSPVAVAREIGRMEERFTPPKPKNTSQAPNPIKPIGGKDAQKVDKSADEESMEEYAARRAASVGWKGRKR